MSKKYLVVSDNHGGLKNLKNVITVMGKNFDGVVHCGDIEFSVEELEDMMGCPVHAARGNCDFMFDRDRSREDLFELDDHHVALVTHGDRYGVSWNFDMIVEHAMEMGADVVFYGHTHRPAYYEMEYDEGIITLMNPGSIELPRQFEPYGPTFAVLHVSDQGDLTPEYYLINRRIGGRKITTFDIEDYQ